MLPLFCLYLWSLLKGLCAGCIMLCLMLCLEMSGGTAHRAWTVQKIKEPGTTWNIWMRFQLQPQDISGYLRISQDISGSAWSALIFLGTILDMELHLNSSISCHPFVSSPVSSAVSRRWILCPARGGKCCTISTSLGDLRDLLASSSHKTWRNVPQAPWPPWWWRDMSGIRLCELRREQD